MSPRLVHRTRFAFRAKCRVRLAAYKSPAIMLCRPETDNKISDVLGVKFEATNIEMNF